MWEYVLVFISYRYSWVLNSKFNAYLSFCLSFIFMYFSCLAISPCVMWNLIRSIIIYLCLPQLSPWRLHSQVRWASRMGRRRQDLRRYLPERTFQWLPVSVGSVVSVVFSVDAFVWLAVLITRQQQSISSIRRVGCKACYIL